MQVRTKFTLMIAVVSFISTAFFTAFAYLELTDEIYDRIDDELTEVGNKFLERIIQDDIHTNPERQVPDIWPLSKYWIKVTDSKDRSFGTRLAQRAALAVRPAPTAASVI